MIEPYTSRGVRTVPGEGGANLPQKGGKAALPYSTFSQNVYAKIKTVQKNQSF